MCEGRGRALVPANPWVILDEAKKKRGRLRVSGAFDPRIEQKLGGN